MAPVAVSAAPISVAGVHHQHNHGLGVMLRSLESHLAHDLEWLEHEVSKDYGHAKHFIGDVFGHLEHVRAWPRCLDMSCMLTCAPTHPYRRSPHLSSLGDATHRTCTRRTRRWTRPAPPRCWRPAAV